MNKEENSKDYMSTMGYMSTMIKKLINIYEETYNNKEEMQGDELDNEMQLSSKAFNKRRTGGV